MGDMTDATTRLEDLILSQLIVREIEKAEAANRDPIDALTAKLESEYLIRVAGAARYAAETIAKSSSPGALIQQGRAARAVAAAAEETRRKWSAKIESQIDQKNAQAAVAKARSGLARATRELRAAQRSGATDRDLVLAEGAQALWQDRVTKSEANLRDVLAKAGGKVEP